MTADGARGKPGAPLEALHPELGLETGRAGADEAGGHSRVFYYWEERETDRLAELRSFQPICIVFCAARLVRPLVLRLRLPEGPHSENTAVVFGNFCALLAPILGFVGSLLLKAPGADDLIPLGLPRALERCVQFERAGLWTLALAVFVDILHQLMGLFCWDYFWNIGVLRPHVRDSDDGLVALATALAVLHAVGLLLFGMMLLSYWRGFRRAWLHPGSLGPRAKERQKRKAKTAPVPSDMEAPPPLGSKSSTKRDEPPPRSSPDAGVKNPPPTTTAAPGRASGIAAAAAAAVAEAAAAAARFGSNENKQDSGEDGSRRTRGPAADEGPREAGRPPPAGPPRPPSGSPGAAPNVSGASASAPSGSSWSGARSGLGTPPRAWLWVGDEWLKVRVLRSGPDGFCTVRMPGGNIIQTRQSMLRQRGSEEEPPMPPPHAAAGSARQPSGAGPASGESAASASSGSRPPRAPPPSSAAGGPSTSSGRPSSASAAEGRPPRGPAGGCAGDKVDRPGTAEGREASEGEIWAAKRMEQLRKELIALDKLEPSERKKELRKLQRELHPDKQPPEMRVHAQPLFHMVQREWELNGAAAGGGG